MPYNLVNIGLGNDLWPDGAKPSPKCGEVIWESINQNVFSL